MAIKNGTINSDILLGTVLADTLSGLDGIDTLYGFDGNDTLNGGLGNDTYVVDNIGDIVTEAAAGGTDLVQSRISYALSANVENLTLSGTASIDGTGNNLANKITGNSANNIIDGGTGIDTMAGGLGNDTYIVDHIGDTVTEAATAGTDVVQASVSHTLLANIEDLTLTGTTAINGTGNNLANKITGNDANNVLNGGGGNDTLDGGLGADSMSGGAGNDIYIVDNIADLVTESVGGGADLIQSSIDYILGTEVENLTLTGTVAINGNGNALNNQLTGNNADNVLDGGTGNDRLNGGAGDDTLIGGAGDDTYIVDSLMDIVTEIAGEGIDTVQSTTNHTLAAEVENLSLLGNAVTGRGNALNNTISGNGQNNILIGDLGADTMIGGAGSDTYIVDDALDVVTEAVGGGIDTIQSTVGYTLGAEVENLTLTGAGAISGTGNALNNRLTGNGGNNMLDGGAGNDTLDGGLGIDTLIGGSGNDAYIVDNTSDAIIETVGGGVDLARSSVTYTLGAEVENLTLTGVGVINGIGNALNNRITGNNLLSFGKIQFISFNMRSVMNGSDNCFLTEFLLITGYQRRIHNDLSAGFNHSGIL